MGDSDIDSQRSRGSSTTPSFSGEDADPELSNEPGPGPNSYLVEEARKCATKSGCQKAIAGLGLFCGIVGGAGMTYGLATGGGITLGGLLVGGTITTASAIATGGLGLLVIGIVLALLYFRNEMISGLESGYYYIKDKLSPRLTKGTPYA